MPVPIVFNDPTVQGVSNYFQIVPFAKSQWSGLSGNLRNFKYIYTVYYIYYYFFCSFWLLFFIIRHTFTGKVNSKGNRQQMSTAISLLAGGVTTKEVTTPMVGLATTTVDQGRTNQVREWDGE
jgi:hypothetical protein